MKIYIFDEEIDKDDEKIIQLLDSSSLFQEKLREIRSNFGIPKFGFDCGTASLEDKYFLDAKGHKLKLAKPFPKENTKSAYNYMAAFLDDPDIAISGNGEFRKKIEEIRKKFGLPKRWYHPICHLVLFSVSGWINYPITSFIDKTTTMSLWKRPGIVIRVSDNISKKQFTKWLDKNWDELRDRLKDELGVEKRTGLPRKMRLKLIRKIEKMKKDGMSFDKIADKLIGQYDPEDPEYKIVESSNALQKLYFRYQKTIGQTPTRKSHKE